MDAGMFPQIIETILSLGDKVWQEVLVFCSGGGFLILWANRKAIGLFVINSIQKMRDSQSVETQEAKKAFGTELAHIMDGMNIMMEQKSEDFNYQLEVAKENLTPEQKIILENGISKSQEWMVKTSNEVMPRLLKSLTEVISATADKITKDTGDND